jgi:multidrug transporter EmrE-like cation transporter
LLLVLVGVFVFREQLSARGVAGILLCVTGLALITRD